MLASRGVQGWLEVEGVREYLLIIVVNIGPHGHGLVFKLVDVSFSLTVAQEGTKPASLHLISDEAEHPCVELKHGGQLDVHHPHEIQELGEYGTPLLISIVTVVVSVSPRKLVPKAQPILVDQLLEAADGAVPAI